MPFWTASKAPLSPSTPSEGSALERRLLTGNMRPLFSSNRPRCSIISVRRACSSMFSSSGAIGAPGVRQPTPRRPSIEPTNTLRSQELADIRISPVPTCFDSYRVVLIICASQTGTEGTRRLLDPEDKAIRGLLEFQGRSLQNLKFRKSRNGDGPQLPPAPAGASVPGAVRAAGGAARGVVPEPDGPAGDV